VICVADRYGGLEDPPLDTHEGRIARYARGNDYHKVMKRRLHKICDELAGQNPEETFRACVDTVPLFERELAAKAGIGAVGKHTLLIDQGVGSWLLLGAIVTTMKLEPHQGDQPDPCGTCTRCIDACPTDAITPWEVDASKCISYLTIEHRTEIDTGYFPAIGHWIFGCDICQEVCPHNQPTDRSIAAPVHEAYKERAHSLDVLEVLDWDDQARQDAFAGSSMKRAKLNMIRRNGVIVAGNILAESSDSELEKKLHEIQENENEDPMVRATAKAVLHAHC
jgi:epoxyqueuosine reductase